MVQVYSSYDNNFELVISWSRICFRNKSVLTDPFIQKAFQIFDRTSACEQITPSTSSIALLTAFQ